MEEGAGSAAAGPSAAPSRTAPPARPARVHTHTHSRDFSDSSRECRARGQPPVSAEVSGCAGGSSVSKALALPQSPPCNPDPRERTRERGRGSCNHAPMRHRLTPRVPPPPPGPQRLHAPEFPTRLTAPRAAGVSGEARGLPCRLWGLGQAAGGEVDNWALSGLLFAPAPEHKVTKLFRSFTEHLLLARHWELQGPTRGIGLLSCTRDGLRTRLNLKMDWLEGISRRKGKRIRSQVLLTRSLILPEGIEEGF